MGQCGNTQALRCVTHLGSTWFWFGSILDKLVIGARHDEGQAGVQAARD